MIDFEERMVTSYQKGGRIEKWKQNADRIFDRQWVESVVDNLNGVDWLPESGGVLISPAANIATHEQWLTEMLPGTLVIAGDLAIDTPVDGVPFARWNAKNLPVTDSTADVIWDMRGALWHAANIDLIKEDVGGWETRQLLDEYVRALKPGGLIVVDDDPTGKMEAELGKFTWTMTGSSGTKPTEISTGAKLALLEKKIGFPLTELAGDEIKQAKVLGEGRHRVRLFKRQ